MFSIHATEAKTLQARDMRSPRDARDFDHCHVVIRITSYDAIYIIKSLK